MTIQKKISELIILTMFLILAVSSGLSQSPDIRGNQIDFLGKVEDSVYTNGYFGLKLPILKNWHLVDQETTSATIQIGADILKSKNERSNKALEDSTKREVVLLHFAKKPIGSIENAMFMMAVLKQPSPSVTPSMVAEATKSVLSKSPNLKVVRNTRIETIASRKFALVDYEITVNGQTAKIKYYATVINGFALTFSLSYVDDTDLIELAKVVEYLKFDGK